MVQTKVLTVFSTLGLKLQARAAGSK